MKRQRFLLLTLFMGVFSGTVARAECHISLSDAQIEYAPVTRGELLSLPENNLSASELRTGDLREFGIMISCERPTPLALQFVGPAKDDKGYRFGDHGWATLVLHDVMIDDRPAEIISVDKHEHQMAFSAGKILRFWKEGGPVTGRTLRGRVTVTTWMPSHATRVGELQTWKLNGNFVVRD